MCSSPSRAPRRCRDTVDQLPVDPCAELDARPVRADLDGVPRGDVALLGLRDRKRRPHDPGAGTGARARARPPAREERPVALEPELADEVLVGARRRRAGASAAGCGASYVTRAGRCSSTGDASPRRRRRRRAPPARRRPRLVRETARRRTALRASRSTPARPAPAARPSGGAAATALRGSAASRRARARRLRTARDPPSRRRARGTSSPRSRAPRARPARVRTHRRRRRHPRRTTDRSAPGSPRPRRQRTPRPRQRRVRSGSREGGTPRNRVCPSNPSACASLGDPRAATATRTRPDQDRPLGRPDAGDGALAVGEARGAPRRPLPGSALHVPVGADR